MQDMSMDKHLKIATALVYSVLVFQVLDFIALSNILLILGPYSFSG